MIIEIGLLVVTYLGAKTIEASRSKKAQRQKSLEPPRSDQEEETESKEDIQKQQLRPLVGAIASMGLFALRGFIPGAGFLGMATYLFSIVPYMKSVEKSLVRDKKVNVDVLFFIGDVLTLGIKNYFTASFSLYLIYSGKYVANKAKDDSSKIVGHLFKELPQKVWILVDGSEVEIPLEEVKVNDLLIVNSGGVIPVDGVIQEGLAQIDQQALTGEGQPAEKGEGDSVFANTIVLAGKILVRVNCSGTETTSAQIAEMLLSSVSFKSGIQLKGEQWADQMTQPMFFSVLAVLPVIGPASTAVLINAHIGVRVQFVAPVTTLKHISEAARQGILVKDGRALEHLCEVDTVLFDKTGTLTTDQPEVKRVVGRNKHTEKEILTYAATAEQKLAHPIARAILTKAKEEAIELREFQKSDYRLGYGISVVIDERLIRVGSIRFLQQEGVKIPQEVIKAQEQSHALGNTFVLVGIDLHVAGFLELQPQIRPEIREMVAQLRAFGIDHMGIVSGDHQIPTKKLADTLGMDEYFYNVLPKNKAQIVEELQAQGRVVCFIGDGINDSIALKQANVSMSIAGASAIARDMAEIIFMDGSLQHLVPLVELSKRLETNLRRSLVICLLPGVTNLLGAFFLNFSILTSNLINSGIGTLGLTNLYFTEKKKIPQNTDLKPEMSLSGDAIETTLPNKE